MDESSTRIDEEINKETDNHNGSEDGNGQFNYRHLKKTKIENSDFSFNM